MHLAALLAELPEDQLERLVIEHLGKEQDISRASLCMTLEGVLRSYSFVRNFIINRQPPTFTILEALLDTDGYALPLSGFREMVIEGTKLLCDRVGSGEILGRDDQLRLYRRVFAEARRSDLTLDPSETAILGVLRRELGIRHVEHFLIEHHPDLQTFWNTEQAFLHEMNALRTSALVFAHAGQVLLAEEVVPLVRQTLGLEMPKANRRRLYERLSGADLNDVLAHVGLKTSGSKQDKVDRLLANYVQPGEVLEELSLATLRELCRETNAQVSGAKDELVERLLEHFLHGADLRKPSDPPPVLAPEPRVLDETRFRALFASLKGDELTDVLAGIGSSRLTGSKETKVSVIWQSRFSEVTLLSELTSRCIEEILSRNRLRTSGAKRDRVDRIVEFFRTLPEVMLTNKTDDAAPAVPEVVQTPPALPEEPGEVAG